MIRIIIISALVSFLFQCSPKKDTTYLKEIQEIDRWLKQTKVTVDGSSIWPDATDQPENVSLSLSDGVASKLIFYLQAYQETGNDNYLNEAKSAATYILDHLPQKEDSLQKVFWAFSPYGNVCGSAYALIETYQLTDDQSYKEGAEHIIDVIKHHAINMEDTISWGLGNDVLGGLAGTGLFLLYAGEVLDRQDLIDLAKQAGQTLIGRAKKDVGLSWKRGQNGRFDLPNFSHGAAGIGYFLARIFEVTQDEAFLDAALKANEYLESIAKTDNGAFLIPYGFPDPGWSRPFDIGWAHGPAGVARFYQQLQKVTGDEKWAQRQQACLKGIRLSGIPGMPTSSEFGTEEFYLDNRFGISSVASFLLDIDAERAFRSQLVEHILSKSSVEADQRSWPQTRFSFMANAGDTTEFTGYFYGATGYGMLLLKHLAKSNGTVFIRFVDDPY